MKERKNSNLNIKQALKGGETAADISKQGPGEAIQAQPLEVKVYGNNFDKALKAFRNLVQKERILSSHKEKQSYEKPSDKRRRKRNEAKRKLLEACSKGFCTHENHKKNFKRDISPE